MHGAEGNVRELAAHLAVYLRGVSDPDKFPGFRKPVNEEASPSPAIEE